MCFVCSMFVTNDVALLTFVPLTVVISRKTKMPIMETVILQTIAANIESSLTPMGNLQNLFIYSHYGIKPIAFFTTVLFIAVFGILSLYFFIRRMPKSVLNVNLTPIVIEDRKKAIVWGTNRGTDRTPPPPPPLLLSPLPPFLPPFLLLQHVILMNTK